MIPSSYTSALLSAIQENLESAFDEIGVAIDLNDYGETFPSPNQMSGSIGIEVTPFAQPVSLGDFKRGYSLTIEIKLTSDQGYDVVKKTYDVREFLLNHLLQKVRKDGVSGVYSDVVVHRALLGLEIKRSPAYIEAKQDNLSIARTIIQIEWIKEV